VGPRKSDTTFQTPSLELMRNGMSRCELVSLSLIWLGKIMAIEKCPLDITK